MGFKRFGGFGDSSEVLGPKEVMRIVVLEGVRGTAELLRIGVLEEVVGR